MSSQSQAKVPCKKVIEEYKLGRSTPGYHVYYNKETDQYIVKSESRGTNQGKPSTNQDSNKQRVPKEQSITPKSDKQPKPDKPRLKQIL